MKNETLTHLSNELVEIVSQYECNCGTVNAEYGCPQCTRWMAAFSRADKELQSVAPEARPIDGLLHAARNAEGKLRYMGQQFCKTNFTDRYGDGPVMLSLADELKKQISEHGPQSSGS